MIMREINFSKTLNKGLSKINYKINLFQDSVIGIIKQGEKESHLKPKKIWLLGIGWTLVGTLSAGIAWLAISETDEIVSVSGIITPSEQTLEVQVPEGGLIKKIHVEEGQKVSEGMLLVELDNRRQILELQKIENTIEASYNRLEKLLASREIALNKFNAEKSTKKKAVTLNKKLLDKLIFLSKQGATSEVQLLQQENRLIMMQDQLNILEINKKDKLNSLDLEIKEIRLDLERLYKDKESQEVRIEYNKIRSTTSGYVFNLKAKSSLNVARTSSTLMEILGEGELKLKVKIPSRDIGLIRNGLNAEVSIDSYPATEFGTIEGHIKDIGLDAIERNQINERDYYINADISLEKQELNARGVKLGLRPGMSGRANIKLRKVKYLELLLGSFRDKSKSLREISGKG